MYQFNDQFTKAAGQFADVASRINRLALENVEKAIGLQLAVVEENVNAAFAFAGELIEVRDANGLKNVLPKGVQVARANVERSFGAAQENFANTVKTGEAIGTLAREQFENASSQVKAQVEKAAKGGNNGNNNASNGNNANVR